MRRRQAFVAWGAACIGFLVLLAVGQVFGWWRSEIDVLDDREILTIETRVTPREHFFGDAVVFEAMIALNGRVVRPQPISFQASFPNYEVRDREETILKYGEIIVYRYRITLQCVVLACLSENEKYLLLPARVHYQLREEETMRTITIPWDIQTYGRVTADDVEDPLFRDGQPWVPAPTFRVPPTALAILSFTAALVLLLSAVSIAARSRGKATPQGIIADDPRWRAMPPIERALRRVRSASYGADLNERRNALDNLAETMKQDAPASDERDAFIREAKELAWPSHDPESEAMQDLATRVKARIGEGR